MGGIALCPRSFSLDPPALYLLYVRSTGTNAGKCWDGTFGWNPVSFVAADVTFAVEMDT